MSSSWLAMMRRKAVDLKSRIEVRDESFSIPHVQVGSQYGLRVILRLENVPMKDTVLSSINWRRVGDYRFRYMDCLRFEARRIRVKERQRKKERKIVCHILEEFLDESGVSRRVSWSGCFRIVLAIGICCWLFEQCA